MTRAEAAAVLGINKSTLTRWTQKHPALLGDDGLVDLEELREHRDSVANPKLQTRGPAARGDNVDRGASAVFLGDAGPAAAGRAAATEAPRGISALNDHRARGEAAKAIGAELDLAERLKLTLVRADVEAQIAQAGEVLKRKAGELAKDRAEALARIEDPRVMERALDDMMRRLLDEGATALVVAMAPPDADDAPDVGETDEGVRAGRSGGGADLREADEPRAGAQA